MAYVDVFQAMTEEQILQRLTIAVADVARDVYVEAPTEPSHDLRLALVAYAGQRTADFRRFAEEVALLILLLNPTLGVASSDGDIKTAVAALWTVYAGLLQAKGLIAVEAAA